MVKTLIGTGSLLNVNEVHIGKTVFLCSLFHLLSICPWLTVLFTKQGIYLQTNFERKIVDGRKNQVNLISIYIIVISIPPISTDDIYSEKYNISVKKCADKERRRSQKISADKK
jgi:hypothetical protein